ncbi:hypothetical protein [Tropicimonas sp. IMCC6043]|nr:hypothetical protein [Tropicimonas sp. IMCC6043]
MKEENFRTPPSKDDEQARTDDRRDSDQSQSGDAPSYSFRDFASI